MFTALDDLSDSVECMNIRHGQVLGNVEVDNWKGVITRSRATFKDVVNQLDRKARSNQSVNFSSNSTRSAHGSDQNSSQASQNQAVKNASVNLEVDADIICEDGKNLAAEVNKFDDWGAAEDHEIEEAMGKIEVWKKRFDKIMDKGWAMQRNTKSYDLDDSLMMSSMALIETLECEMNMAIEHIVFEDDTRQLYSLAKSTTASVKLPIFSGEQSEDFTRFRKEMEKGFKTNRVKRFDQTSKLRESLKNHPRNLIPNTLDDFEEAWRILQSIYGDPSRVMAARKKKISGLGSFPKDDKKGGIIKKQVEWLISLEITLKDIMELAQDDEEMEMEAYNGSMLSSIRLLFPFDIEEDLAKIRGTGKYKVSKIIEYIGTLREGRQEMLKDREGVGGSLE